jgi:hypothetical protein
MYRHFNEHNEICLIDRWIEIQNKICSLILVGLADVLEFGCTIWAKRKVVSFILLLLDFGILISLKVFFSIWKPKWHRLIT